LLRANVWFCVANSKGLTVEAGKGYFIFFDGLGEEYFADAQTLFGRKRFGIGRLFS
jgi:hypothetical protein